MSPDFPGPVAGRNQFACYHTAMLKRIQYPILYVTNMAVSRHFYVDILGFTLRDDDGDFVELRLGDTCLALNSALDDTKYPGHQTILLDSDDIEADFATLASAVRVTVPLTEESFGKTFIFADPDGNKIEVVENGPHS
jgi:catechol 2,3-dioxygenase-like lactoylglutathione lyase family enzyme